MNFECMNCGGKTKIAVGSNVSVICQGCGCADVKFDQDIGISIVGFHGPYEVQPVKANDSFLGRHKEGLIWRIHTFPLPKEEPKEIPKEEVKEVPKVTLKTRRK